MARLIKLLHLLDRDFHRRQLFDRADLWSAVEAHLAHGQAQHHYATYPCTRCRKPEWWMGALCEECRELTSQEEQHGLGLHQSTPAQIGA